MVCMLMTVLLVQGVGLQKKIHDNNDKEISLVQRIADENTRTQEIEELQEYMKSDEYIEKAAKEKIGMIKDNEIIFKETD